MLNVWMESPAVALASRVGVERRWKAVPTPTGASLDDGMAMLPPVSWETYELYESPKLVRTNQQGFCVLW